MEGWKKDKLGNLLEFVYGKSLPKSKRSDGNIPVYGSNGIVGFHDEAIVNEPGIIVGRKGSAGNIHFSNVPFCPIDTTFYITQQHSKLELDYLYYALNFLNLKRILGDVGVPGLNREMAYLEELFYPSDKAEQRKIAHVLSTVQKAIEQQDNLIRTTIELKKALMQKLFTEGTRGEPQKETEIGLVPESWDVVELGNTVDFKTGKLNSNAAVENGTYPFFTCSQETFAINNFAFDQEAILLTGNNARAIYSVKHYKGKFNAYQRTYVITILNDAEYDYTFLKYVLTRQLEYLRTISIGSQTRYLTLGMLTTLQIQKPDIDEQRKIAKSIYVLENKIEILEMKKQTLTTLFKTLLHELMTGQRRVHELEFEALESQTSL